MLTRRRPNSNINRRAVLVRRVIPLQRDLCRQFVPCVIGSFGVFEPDFLEICEFKLRFGSFSRLDNTCRYSHAKGEVLAMDRGREISAQSPHKGGWPKNMKFRNIRISSKFRVQAGFGRQMPDSKPQMPTRRRPNLNITRRAVLVRRVIPLQRDLCRQLGPCVIGRVGVFESDLLDICKFKLRFGIFLI